MPRQAKTQSRKGSAHELLDLPTRDALAASLRRIDTLAGLLCAASEQAIDESIGCELVGDAAGMIAEETARLRAVLGSFLEAQD